MTYSRYEHIFSEYTQNSWPNTSPSSTDQVLAGRGWEKDMALINLIVTKTLNAKCEVSHEEERAFCSIFTSGTTCARSLS